MGLIEQLWEVIIEYCIALRMITYVLVQSSLQVMFTIISQFEKIILVLTDTPFISLVYLSEFM